MDIDRSATRFLPEEECWSRIENAPYGRIVTAAADVVDIFPVNHLVDERSIVFRTAAGTKLLELTIRMHVLFQIDGYTDAEAFSVVVKGSAAEITLSREVDRLDQRGLVPWAPETKDRWVRISPAGISGVAFERALRHV